MSRINVGDGVGPLLEIRRHASRALMASAGRPIGCAATGTERRGGTVSPNTAARLSQVGGEAGSRGRAFHAMRDIDARGSLEVRILSQDVRVVPVFDLPSVDASEQARVELDRRAAQLRLRNGVEDANGANGDGNVQHLAVMVDQLLEARCRHGDVTRTEVGEGVVAVAGSHKLLHACARADGTVGHVEALLGARSEDIEGLPEPARWVGRARAVHLEVRA
mmetsp:Transcript_22644/g.69151  ORF Transcript_22644/g.69151 Transcript_22644/m.69151 type:complete len:221 (+) Transcript_22644:973-1635(+)